jgi:hypothetical protein
MRALICHTFPGYDFERVDDLVADDFAEVAGAALWVKEQEAKAASSLGRKGKRR